MRRRRQFHTRGRQVVDFTDEVLGRPGGGERGDAALLAAVNAPRGDGMRDEQCLKPVDVDVREGRTFPVIE